MHACVCVGYVRISSKQQAMQASSVTPTLVYAVHGPGASVQTHLVPGQPRLPRQQVLIGVARVPADRESERDGQQP